MCSGCNGNQNDLIFFLLAVQRAKRQMTFILTVLPWAQGFPYTHLTTQRIAGTLTPLCSPCLQSVLQNMPRKASVSGLPVQVFYALQSTGGQHPTKCQKLTPAKHISMYSGPGKREVAAIRMVTF